MTAPRFHFAEFKLLTAAVIWGLAFVAQSEGAKALGPFSFNAIRFCLGALVLLPRVCSRPLSAWKSTCLPGVLSGILLCCASSFQTVGIIYTTSGKTAFITCLYLIFIPLAERLLRKTVSRSVWIGALLALVGLWCLCLHGNLALSRGDFLVLISALFWSAQFIYTSHTAVAETAADFAFWQFLTCALLSLPLAAAAHESFTFGALHSALVPVLYNGIFSIGIGFTLQASGLAGTTASRGATILSLETVFAAICGEILLGEHLSGIEIAGCALMLAGTTTAQFGGHLKAQRNR